LIGHARSRTNRRAHDCAVCRPAYSQGPANA
jgi:hypothetical protein